MIEKPDELPALDVLVQDLFDDEADGQSDAESGSDIESSSGEAADD